MLKINRKQVGVAKQAVVFALVIWPLSLFADEPNLSYNRDVRPILSDNCFQCHGPDAKTRKADLRLDHAEGAFGGGTPAIVPGKPAQSPLWKRITSTDPDEAMPPPESKKKLTPQQTEILKTWIAQGAKYQKHWAFEPIQPTAVPPPANQSKGVDFFLNAKLKQLGLTVQPEANRETLIRRVSFALTGFPPTIPEIDAFLADKSPTAYEKMVDRYLASRSFGEEMSRHWLDVARYADTHGLHLDNERQMWAYRDWVVQAFNDNLPFDQFTIWQLAGDLLPNPTPEQLVATGFNRCNVTTSEGGSIEAEFVYRYAVERATTTAQVWLGLTAGCAVCHDHKFDPLSMKEFYSLYAFFHSAADPAMDGNINTTAPFLKLPTPQLQATTAAASRAERESRALLETLADKAAYVDPAETKEPVARKAVRDVLLDDTIPLGSIAKSNSRNAVAWVTEPDFKTVAGRRAIRQEFASNRSDSVEFKLRPVIVPHDATLEVWVRLEPLDIPKSISVGVTGPGGKTVTWTKTETGLARGGAAQDIVTPGKWTKLAMPVTELGMKAGDRLNGISLAQSGGICSWDALSIRGEADPVQDSIESLTAWRKAIGTTAPPDLPADLNAIVQAGPAKKLTEDELAKLTRFYVAIIARPLNDEIAAARTAWDTARAARVIAEDAAPGTFVFRDMEKPRDSFVMVRGQYDKPGEQVVPAIPAILPQIKKTPAQARLNRLDLAQWLMAPENPLTARVTVNRFWQQFFGTGLVKTSFDFGSQGESPSHPELLDWLATEYRATGWNTKQFVKLLVNSEAFRRQAKLTPEVRTADPHNRFYARGPRFRLDAEQVRDNVLFVSGLLDPTMGGRGVNPYQPPNIWEPVGYSDSNTRFYLQSHGASLYRRSLYVFLKRTAPPPFMSNFDGPNREQVCAVRERSNTPLQALQLMNDVQHYEAARALAERILSASVNSDENRIGVLFRTVLSRHPAPDEMKLVSATLAKQRQLYRADPAAAKAAIHSGESSPKNVAPAEETAAWTMLANLVLNMDETVNRN